MDASEIQDLIDRLESLKKRQVELIDEQIALTKKVAEAVLQNDHGRAFRAAERDQAELDRGSRSNPKRERG